jgi:hypothetical protein
VKPDRVGNFKLTPYDIDSHMHSLWAGGTHLAHPVRALF